MVITKPDEVCLVRTQFYLLVLSQSKFKHMCPSVPNTEPISKQFPLELQISVGSSLEVQAAEFPAKPSYFFLHTEGSEVKKKHNTSC